MVSRLPQEEFEQLASEVESHAQYLLGHPIAPLALGREFAGKVDRYLAVLEALRAEMNKATTGGSNDRAVAEGIVAGARLISEFMTVSRNVTEVVSKAHELTPASPAE